MLFNSFEFILFLPIVFALYWFVFNRSLKWQNTLVLLASYGFYGWWSWRFMGLLMLCTALDYAYGFWVASPNRKKAKLFLWLSIINNLGILAVFKYYNFFATQFQLGFDALGWHTHPILLDITLPIGISFYTFHGMSYVFDIYRGQQTPVKSFIDYAVFVSFFPLLVAGPIERANHLLPQVQKNRLFNYTQAVEGCRLIIWGLFKKVVIADNLALLVDEVYLNHEVYNGGTLALAAVAFSFQIYGDFSGYSDIALGTAKLFGFELLSNFKFPYLARDVAEFWRRWHISLSSWFRDYLYIPLGGSKLGQSKAIRNTFIIFLVSGFWHGASWNFIVWGGIHACGFLPLLLLKRNRQYVDHVVAENRLIPTLKECWQIISTFVFVTFAWVFFRAETLTKAWQFLVHLFKHCFDTNSKAIESLSVGSALGYMVILVISDWYLRKDERRLKVMSNKAIRYALYLLLVFFILINFNAQSRFIYFQF